MSRVFAVLVCLGVLEFLPVSIHAETLEALRDARGRIEVDGMVLRLHGAVGRDLMPGFLPDTDSQTEPDSSEHGKPMTGSLQIAAGTGATHLLGSESQRIQVTW